MGQRLIVHVVGKDKDGEDIDLAAVYFHWSAYTLDSLTEAAEVVNLIEGREVKRPILRDMFGDSPHLEIAEVPAITEGASSDWRLRLIRGLEALGGGIDEDDREFIQKMYPDETFSADHDRSYGLVAFSPEGIRNLCGWEEGSVYLHLDDRTAESWAYTGPFEHYEDFAEDCREYAGVTPPEGEKIPVWNYDMEEIPFDDLQNAGNAMKKICTVLENGQVNEVSWYFKDKLGRYCGIWA